MERATCSALGPRGEVLVVSVVHVEVLSFGELVTIALVIDGRWIGEVVMAVERTRAGRARRARIFDVEIRGGFRVTLGRT